MTLSNCKDCGALISNAKDGLCNECSEVRSAEMSKIRDCVRFDSQLSVSDLSQKTGIPVRRLIQFMHEGLIQIKE